MEVWATKLADEWNLEISVCYFHPGTRKWNKIEHSLLSQISQNWRGIPLVDQQTVVELTTTTGLKIKVMVDKNTDVTWKKISDEDFVKIYIKNAFHGEWNYTIVPNTEC